MKLLIKIVTVICLLISVVWSQNNAIFFTTVLPEIPTSQDSVYTQIKKQTEVYFFQTICLTCSVQVYPNEIIARVSQPRLVLLSQNEWYVPSDCTACHPH